MSNSQTYLDAVERLKSVDWASIPTFPDEVEFLDVIYIQSEIGGRENKLPSGEELAVYMPKDFEMCLILERFPGARTFPQIIVDGKHIGGFDDLEAFLNK